MKTKYKPYGFDEKYEFRTYKNIGRDYGDRKIADMGLVGNIKRFFRKKMNRKQKKYTMGLPRIGNKTIRLIYPMGYEIISPEGILLND